MEFLETADADVFNELLLYAQGYFPMANEEGELHWYKAKKPALLPLDERFHISKSMTRLLKRIPFQTAINQNFEAVLQGCSNRPETWISEELKAIYRKLHIHGYAYSFETYDAGNLAGGVLGICLGGVFIGESMFTKIPNGGKAALIYLVKSLKYAGFKQFDCQLLNENTQRFGGFEIEPKEHQDLYAVHLHLQVDFRKGYAELLRKDLQ